MIGFCALFLTCLGVTPGPDWSNPILVTDSANTIRRIQYLHLDDLGRFHMVWEGMNDESRIGYKIFLLDGTTVYPETMISSDNHSTMMSKIVMGDSLIVFWRDYNPIYYAIRSIEDGSEITPATYLFTTNTIYSYIRACPDSLGRLHVLFNRGADVYYAVWTPAPGSGFITEYEWKIEGASSGGVLLVDGNRVHVVVQDPVYHDFCYVQYDLDGNTVVPLIDFVDGDINCTRFPELALDSQGNLMVVEITGNSYDLWKLDKTSGLRLINQKVIVSDSLPDMAVGVYFILRNLPGTEEFYLCWTDAYRRKKVFNLLMDEDGNVLVDWHIAYDYSDEDPEDVKGIDGVVDADGNLYIIYSQGETEPVLGGYPTFGWFNHDYLGVEGEGTTTPPVVLLTASPNPSCGGVQFILSTNETTTLKVFDLLGRQVSSVEISDGTGFWNGTAYSGEKLPAGVYTVVCAPNVFHRFSLLN